MVRYRGPRLRITRRLGDLPGLTRKLVPANRAFPPGQHGRNTKKPSDNLIDRKSTRLNSSHVRTSRMPSSA